MSETQSGSNDKGLGSHDKGQSFFNSKRYLDSIQDAPFQYFKRLLVPHILADPTLRIETLQSIFNEITGLQKEILLPNNQNIKKLRNYLGTIVRLSNECPIQDIADACTNYLTKFKKEHKITIPEYKGPSSFFSKEVVAPLIIKDEEKQTLLEEIFIQSGRFTHFEHVMLWFIDYLKTFSITYNYVMRINGPLPLQWRNYIAIMAASRHSCDYLVCFMEEEFLKNGGDPTWLSGLGFIPPKLANLQQLNSLLAHQPWLLKKEHIESLIHNKDETWSIAELVHVIVLLCTFHSFSGLVLGCGILPEIDFYVDYYNESHFEPVSGNKVNAEQLTNKLFERLNGYNDNSDTETNEDKAKIFAKVETEDWDPSAVEKYTKRSQYVLRYIGNYQMHHVDFDITAYSVFRAQEYNWEQQGYSLIQRFYSELAPLLDQEFKTSFEMTDNTLFQHKDVDTLPFRRSIWYYVHRIMGVSHDDYDYREVNQILDRPLKQYIKKVACSPETISFNDFQNIGLALRVDEKCHINIIALEARKQAELLHGLHAVMMCMNRD